MDHAFVITRNDTTSSADLRKVSIEPDTDKALKNFEARTQGARAKFANDINHGHSIEVNVTLPDDADEAATLKAFHEDLAHLHLVAKARK
jgi:hypothetical protein